MGLLGEGERVCPCRINSEGELRGSDSEVEYDSKVTSLTLRLELYSAHPRSVKTT